MLVNAGGACGAGGGNSAGTNGNNVFSLSIEFHLFWFFSYLEKFASAVDAPVPVMTVSGDSSHRVLSQTLNCQVISCSFSVYIVVIRAFGKHWCNSHFRCVACDLSLAIK